jgi:hypothetical protein
MVRQSLLFVVIFVKNHPGTALKSPNRSEDYPLGSALR